MSIFNRGDIKAVRNAIDMEKKFRADMEARDEAKEKAEKDNLKAEKEKELKAASDNAKEALKATPEYKAKYSLLENLENIYTSVQPAPGDKLYIDKITNNERNNILKTFIVKKDNYSTDSPIFGLFKIYHKIIDANPDKIDFYLINLLAHMIKYHDDNLKTLNIEGANIPQLVKEIKNEDMKIIINTWLEKKSAQAGGRYKEKYLKYKTKYLNLRQIM
jgi:hypothetical protein